jgi:hypothetical protein
MPALSAPFPVFSIMSPACEQFKRDVPALDCSSKASNPDRKNKHFRRICLGIA